MKVKQVMIAAVTGLSMLGVGFWLGGASAATAEPGSSADPLVSKSYVDNLISGLLTRGQVETMVAPLADKSYVDSRITFQVVTVPQGSRLVGEGGTEIVLRGGQATVVASANGGVLDVSDGVDLSEGVPVKPNHVLVVPRTDGRGILAKTDVVLLVKGPYTIAR